MTSTNELIDKEVANGSIALFEYNEFSDVKKVANGAFGTVYRTYWKCEIELALKEIDIPVKDNVNRFLRELKSLIEVSSHPNINKFLGITKEPSSNNYIMVLEYANQGNLREYLKNNFKSLQWNDKARMAVDIASGLRWLHSKEIIHRDLHSKNILIHNNRLLIADFGLSKQLSGEITSDSTDDGMVPYIDPQCYKVDKYVRDKKSDIYSLGVLLWEIASGYPPFLDISYFAVIRKISDGDREQLIEDAPLEYTNLYQKCWDENPNLRPNLIDVLMTLLLLPLETFDIDIKIIKLVELMEEYGILYNRYVWISDKIKKFTPKQIRQRWVNVLNPKLCHKPLNEYEKSFIIQWVENNKADYPLIPWKILISAMKDEFGNLRSENMVKNFWYFWNRKSKSGNIR
ncbi:kinase-like domain-containing protein [Glomus cerebriforme]|uniref:Kinase-like domain-containing protein n=1 Tax=Glomus cerebriforme TaxID=658196 RepID=A0A397SQC4_9GLOM|nr:kinase-like domain-containing protein [Glomus cerebriforme]